MKDLCGNGKRYGGEREREEEGGATYSQWLLMWPGEPLWSSEWNDEQATNWISHKLFCRCYCCCCCFVLCSYSHCLEPVKQCNHCCCSRWQQAGSRQCNKTSIGNWPMASDRANDGGVGKKWGRGGGGVSATGLAWWVANRLCKLEATTATTRTTTQSVITCNIVAYHAF